MKSAATQMPPIVQVQPGPVLPNLNKPKRKKQAKPIPPVGPALALSGGAAHGDFEVGVVSYLYQHGLVPKIICGTSVGAINGLKLAEGEPTGPATPDADGHIQGLAGLIEIWKSLKYNTDMYKKHSLLDELQSALKSLVTGLGVGSLIGGSVGGPIGLFLGALVGGRVEEDTVISAVQDLMKTSSLADFNPLDTRMKEKATFKPGLLAQSKITLRMAMTSLEDGALRLVDEKGHLLESDGTPAQGPPRYSAAANATLAKIKQLEDLIDSLVKGMDSPDTDPKEHVSDVLSLRAEVMQLKASIAGDIIGSEPIEVPLTQAALASSSLPVFTPPQLFNDGNNYVDGGTRMVTPIETALELGGTVVYAVVASSDKMGPGTSFPSNKPLPSFTSANLIDIGLRVGSEIEPSAINDSQLTPPNGFPVPVLIFRPRYDIHDSLTVAPGLIDIRMDQGWMCGDDVMQAWALDSDGYLELAQEYDELRGTTLIARRRHQIWIHEFAANGWQYMHDATGAPIDATGAPPVPILVDREKTIAAALAKVRGMKRDLRDLVQKRVDAHGNIPPHAERWWTDWERHTWVPDGPLWPPLKMKVTAKPSSGVPLDRQTTITITATDDGGKPIEGATVYAGGRDLGPTGSLHATFASMRMKKIDPKTHAQTITVTGPHVEVAAASYETTPVPIRFDTSTATP